MGFLDDIVSFTGFGPFDFGAPSFLPAVIDPPFTGTGPGLDLGDIQEFGSALLKGFADFPFNIGAGGVVEPVRAVQPGATRGGAPPEIGAGPPSLGNGNGGARLQTTGARTAMYIAGSCPGLWHTTPVRPLFDRHTGEFLKNVGGNRVANRVSLVQDDSGALEFVSPVKATWSLKHKPRRSYHKHVTRHRGPKHHRHRKAAGHRHSLTRKQLAAGFGGKSHMRAH